jgi:hypothetical protein
MEITAEKSSLSSFPPASPGAHGRGHESFEMLLGAMSRGRSSKFGDSVPGAKSPESRRTLAKHLFSVPPGGPSLTPLNRQFAVSWKVAERRIHT